MAGLTPLLEKYGSKLTASSVNMTIRWFGALAPVATGIIGTFLLNWKYRDMEPGKKRDLVRQEGITQAVNMTCHLLSFFGLGALAKRSLARVPEAALNGQLKELLVTLVMNIGGLLGAAVVRPIIGGQLLMQLLNKEKKAEAQNEGQEMGADRFSSELMRPAPVAAPGPVTADMVKDAVSGNPQGSRMLQPPRIANPQRVSLPLQPNFSQQPYGQAPMAYYGPASPYPSPYFHFR